MKQDKPTYHPWILAAAVAVGVLLLLVALTSGPDREPIDPRQLAADVRAGTVERIATETDSNAVTVFYAGQPAGDGQAAARPAPKTLYLPEGVDILELLESVGIDPATTPVPVVTTPPSAWSGVGLLLTTLLPVLLLVGVVLFFTRRAQGPGQEAFSFGKSRARRFVANRPTVTFADVAGADEAKQELVEVVEFLKYPDKFAALGRAHPARGAPGGAAGDGEDLAVAGGGGGGGGAVLLDLGVGVRGDVRGGGRLARAGPVRAGQAQRAVHHLHRRDRRGRAAARGGAGRLARRARADAQPDPGGDGRLRLEHQHHHHRRHQPPGRAGPGAAAAGALRPAGGAGPAGREGAAGDPRRAHARQAAGGRLPPGAAGEADARLRGRTWRTW